MYVGNDLNACGHNYLCAITRKRQQIHDEEPKRKARVYRKGTREKEGEKHAQSLARAQTHTKQPAQAKSTRLGVLFDSGQIQRIADSKKALLQAFIVHKHHCLYASILTLR